MKIKVNSELSQTIQDIDFTGSIAANSELVKAILLLAHPVGSYYWSSDSTSPATLFGGTWTQIKDKFIIAVGDSHTVGTSYGSNTKDISHTHGIGHTHGVPGVAHTHSIGHTHGVPGVAHTHDSGSLYANIGSPQGNSMALGFTATNWHGNNSTYSVGGNSSTASGHPARSHDTPVGGTTSSTTPDSTTTNSQSASKSSSTTPSSTTTNSQSTSTSGSGGSTTLDITPACEAAYCWRRTA